MCEILAAAWPEPRPFALLLPYVRKMERLGVAGFGWGVAWLSGGFVEAYRCAGAVAGDRRGRLELASVVSTRFLVHLRRPSRLSTTQLADTQPFLQGEGRFAFCHNGSFHRHERYRPGFAGRLHGSADSEIAFRLFEELLPHSPDVPAALHEVVDRLGGSANLGYLGADGRLLVRFGHRANLVWRFGIDDGDMAATELHSRDDSLFDLVFQEATERIHVVDVAELDPGRAAVAAPARIER